MLDRPHPGPLPEGEGFEGVSVAGDVAVVGGAIDAAGEATGTAVVRPCGRCRQLLAEAAQLGGRDLIVHSAAAQGDLVETRTIAELLPDAFGPGDLGFA